MGVGLNFDPCEQTLIYLHHYVFVEENILYTVDRFRV